RPQLLFLEQRGDARFRPRLWKVGKEAELSHGRASLYGMTDRGSTAPATERWLRGCAVAACFGGDRNTLSDLVHDLLCTGRRRAAAGRLGAIVRVVITAVLLAQVRGSAQRVRRGAARISPAGAGGDGS